MKQRTLALIGIAVTAIIMIGLAYSVFLYSQDPDSTVGMAAMGMLSSCLMVFLILFALLYTRPSPKSDYMEIYQGVCSRCGALFGEDGICPGCGRRRPSRPGQ